MTRQLEQKQELRETARRDALIKSLEYGLVGALEHQGIQLLGFAIKYDEFSCLMTLRVIQGGSRAVAFVGSDTITNCILKADMEARHSRLKWRADKYNPSDD